MKKLSWAYVSGFFDGEGTVCLDCGYLRIKFYQKKPKVLRLIKAFLVAHGFSCNIYHKLAKPPSSRNIRYPLPCHMYHLAVLGGEKGSIQVLKRMLPWLIVKRARALELLKQRDGKVKTYVER